MMPFAVIEFPAIDPIAFSIGPVAIRWYALAYIVGIVFAIWYGKKITTTPHLWGPDGAAAKPQEIDDLLLWSTLGVFLGGRLGYVLFYKPLFYLNHPVEIFQTWHGGMSFHGGFLGVLVAFYIFSRRRAIQPIRLLDIAATGVPIGLGLGRLANFINGELYGHITTVPWAMVFPDGGPEPRHPSQLYEASLEGLLLFCIITIAVWRFKALARPGLMSGIFTLGYGLSRFIVEFFRQPDAHLGFLAGGFLTMGMILSLPLMLIGIWLILRALRTS